MSLDLYVGIDSGSKTTKIVYDAGNEIRSKKTASVICKAPEGIENLESLERTVKTIEDNMLVSVNGEDFLFGNIALEQGRYEDLVEPIRGNLLTDIYKANEERDSKDSDRASIVIAGILGLIDTQKTYDDLPDTIMKICTGVPIETSTELVNELESLYKGIHKFKIKNLATGETQKRKIWVKECMMIKEPIGTLYDSIYDTNGLPRMKGGKVDQSVSTLLTQVVGIYDMGYGTYCSYLRGPNGAILKGCGTNESAHKRFIFELSQDLSRLLKANGYSNLDMPNQYEIDNATKTKALRVRLEKLEGFESVVQNTTRRFVRDNISRDLENYFIKNNIETLIVTGGPAKDFAPHIRDYLMSRKQSQVKVKVPEDPEMANAYGFYKYLMKKMK